MYCFHTHIMGVDAIHASIHIIWVWMQYDVLLPHPYYCIQKILGKAKRWHIVNSDFAAVDLLRDNDFGLFHAVKASNHCLNHLFAPKKNRAYPQYGSSTQGHKFALPTLKSYFARKSYVNRSLFIYIYNYSEQCFTPDIASDLLYCCIIVFTNCIICIARIVTQSDCL